MMMTARERVCAVINGRIPDRVPVDIGGTTLSGISVDEYAELAAHLGIDAEQPKVVDTYQMLARVSDEMRQWFGGDVVSVENPSIAWGYRNEGWKPWATPHGTPVLVPGQFHVEQRSDGVYELFDASGKLAGQMPDKGYYFDKVFPDVKADLMGDIVCMDPDVFRKSIPVYSDDELRQIQTRAQFLHRYTQYSVHGEFLRGNLGTGGVFAGHPLSQWLCVTMLEPEYAAEMVEVYAQATLENFKLYRQAVGDCVDTIFVSATDYGTQNGEMYTPDVFKEIYLPNYKKINTYIHENSPYKIIFHSCGSIRNILPYFVEAGVDILNPVQTSAAGMDPQTLKSLYGDKLVFWGGGVDTQGVFPNGTPEQVRAQVKERIEIFGRGGGFVFSPVHNIQYGVPLENIVAMVEAVREFGAY